MDTKSLQDFIDGLLANDAIKLRRGFGIGLFLYNQLRDRAPDYILDNLQVFDKLTLEKKKVILKEVKKFLEEYERLKGKSVPSLQKNRKPVNVFKKPVSELSFLTDGEKKVLKSLKVNTVLDALYFFPLKYEDRRVYTTVKAVRTGEKATIKLRVKEVRELKDDEKYTAEVVCTDGEEIVKLKFRYKNTNFLYALFKRNSVVVVSGRLRRFRDETYIVHPEVLKNEDYGAIFPVYYIRGSADALKLPSKARQKKIRSAIRKIVQKASKYFPEVLPEKIVKKYELPDPAYSFEVLHLPEDVDVKALNEFKDPYHKRFIYEDLFLFQTALLLKKKETEGERSPKIDVNIDEFLEDFKKKIPFKLTSAQERVLREILEDLNKEKPMNRLLQGDVGSGKTVVAMASALAVVKSGFQVAVMVPTEILAQQHYKKFKEFFEKEGIRVGLLTGSLTPAQKMSAYKHIREGNIHIVVGTHALIQEKVEFKKLGLVIIDEQHRFGVMQRKLLIEKGKGLYPHCLVMSATPIPRTLALSLYGDLDISIIDELPPGRKNTRTSILFRSERKKLVEIIKRELKEGNKVYIVYPIIEESESLDLKSAVQEYENWKKILEGYKVFLLHGKMSDREKLEVMERFKKEGDVLVSTTVIEVGIDVPEATLMIIEDAHRFGLSQLHQLRGRVGRSDRQSYCYLVIPDELRKDEEVMRRLKVLVRTNNGFEVSEMDLKLRGPGELLGVSQSGYFGFNIANLARALDRELLVKAREDAKEILEEDPKLEKYKNLRELLLYRYGDKIDLSYIA